MKLFKAAVLAALLLSAVGGVVVAKGLEETRLRNNVVKLINGSGSCSGSQIVAPSGTTYILTAAHCKVLEVDHSIEVVDADGNHLQRRVIAEDPKSDLLLLEGIPNHKAMKIAKSVEMNTHVRTYTHGKGFDTYRTDGDIVQEFYLEVPLREIEDKADEAACAAMPKQKVKEFSIFFGMITIKACVLAVTEVVTTAKIVPGSSGGMVVDDNGHQIGVVSAGDGDFGYLVPLKDIQAFLSGY